MGSVICRSMENSVGERTRKQLREARGIGGLICRIDVTTGLWSDVSRRNARGIFSCSARGDTFAPVRLALQSEKVEMIAW